MVDVASPMEGGGDVNYRVVTRDLNVADVADPMGEERDVK